MAKYHINPETGRPNLCSAEDGNCPYKSSDGSPAPHFNTKEEARIYNEKEMNKEYGKSAKPISKPNKKVTQKDIATANKELKKYEKKIDGLNKESEKVRKSIQAIDFLKNNNIDLKDNVEINNTLEKLKNKKDGLNENIVKIKKERSQFIKDNQKIFTAERRKKEEEARLKQQKADHLRGGSGGGCSGGGGCC